MGSQSMEKLDNPVLGAGRNSVSSEVFHEANSCLRKIPYAKNKAIAAAIRLKEEIGRNFDVYECQYCGHYHVGKSNRKAAGVS